MSFSSVFFLYFVLPVFFAVYALLKPRFRRAALSVGSCLFVAWQTPFGLIPMAVSVLTAYLGGIFIGNLNHKKNKSRAVLVAAIVINAAVFLCFAKSAYNGAGLFQLLSDGSLKLFAAFGVSVYTLQSISYCADVYSGDIQPQTAFFKVFAYVTFMPCLTCGPLLRYSDVAQTLEAPVIKSALLSDGILLFLSGLAEKVIIADQLAVFRRDICSVGFEKTSAVTAWLAAVIFGFWFYYEFQSFSHMARGLAMMFGFELRRNFEMPFMKLSVTEFFRSFNTSLHDWISRYIYSPLGGKVEGSVVLSLKNILLAALFMGLWYGFGMNYIIWALYIALICAVELLLGGRLERLPKIFRFIAVHILLIIGWALLSGKNVAESFSWISAMFGENVADAAGLSAYFIKSSAAVLVLCIVCASPIFRFIENRLDNEKITVITAAKPAMILALMILCTAFMLFQHGGTVFSF